MVWYPKFRQICLCIFVFTLWNYLNFVSSKQWLYKVCNELKNIKKLHLIDNRFNEMKNGHWISEIKKKITFHNQCSKVDVLYFKVK